MGYRRGNEVIAYNIVAQNVQINTLGDVAYVRMELALLGISNPSTNVELAESRVSKRTHSPPPKEGNKGKKEKKTSPPKSNKRFFFFSAKFIADQLQRNTSVHRLHLQQPRKCRPLRQRRQPMHRRHHQPHPSRRTPPRRRQRAKQIHLPSRLTLPIHARVLCRNRSRRHRHRVQHQKRFQGGHLHHTGHGLDTRRAGHSWDATARHGFFKHGLPYQGRGSGREWEYLGTSGSVSSNGCRGFVSLLSKSD